MIEDMILEYKYFLSYWPSDERLSVSCSLQIYHNRIGSVFLNLDGREEGRNAGRKDLTINDLSFPVLLELNTESCSVSSSSQNFAEDKGLYCRFIWVVVWWWWFFCLVGLV